MDLRSAEILSRCHRVVLGCESLGGVDWGAFDEKEAIAVIREAIERRTIAFDVADVYGLGLAETRLGRALGLEGVDATVVTKVGVRWKRQQSSTQRARTWRDCRPRYLTSAVEASAKRLGLRVIPVVLAHWPDGVTKLDDTYEALARLVERGTIRSFGFSNFDVDDLARLSDNRCNGLVLQRRFGLLSPVRSRREAIDALSAGIFFAGYDVLGQGLLTAKYSGGSRFGDGDRRSQLTRFSAGYQTLVAPLLAQLRRVAEVLDVTAAQVAIQWALSQEGVGGVVVGAKTRAQLRENVDAAGIALSADELGRLSDVAARIENSK